MPTLEPVEAPVEKPIDAPVFRSSWNKGISGYSTSWKGGHHSNLAKDKMRVAKVGKTLSLEHRKKISDALKGRTPKNLSTLDNSGSNSHWWKGGVSTDNEKQRKCQEYKKWRNLVYFRDDYKCQKCLENSHNLHPHHILNYSSHKELRFVPSNGVTLCEVCHRSFHSIFGSANNNLDQLNKYLCQ